MLQLLFLQENKAHFFHPLVNQKLCNCKGVLFRKMGCFLPCVNPVSSKFPETAIIDSSRYSNFFLAATGSISSVRPWVENFTLVEMDFFWKIIRFDPCVKFLIVQSSQKNLINFDLSRFSNSSSSQTLSFDFFHQGFNSKLHLLTGAFE